MNDLIKIIHDSREYTVDGYTVRAFSPMPEKSNSISQAENAILRAVEVLRPADRFVEVRKTIDTEIINNTIEDIRLLSCGMVVKFQDFECYFLNMDIQHNIIRTLPYIGISDASVSMPQSLCIRFFETRIKSCYIGSADVQNSLAEKECFPKILSMRDLIVGNAYHTKNSTLIYIGVTEVGEHVLVEDVGGYHTTLGKSVNAANRFYSSRHLHVWYSSFSSTIFRIDGVKYQIQLQKCAEFINDPNKYSGSLSMDILLLNGEYNPNHNSNFFDDSVGYTKEDWDNICANSTHASIINTDLQQENAKFLASSHKIKVVAIDENVVSKEECETFLSKHRYPKRPWANIERKAGKIDSICLHQDFMTENKTFVDFIKQNGTIIS